MRAISRGLLKAASRFAFAFRKDAPHTFKVSCFDCMVLGMMLHPIDNLPQCGPSGCWPRPRIPVGRPVPGGGAVPGTGGHRAEGREASRDGDQVARRPSRGR